MRYPALLVVACAIVLSICGCESGGGDDDGGGNVNIAGKWAAVYGMGESFDLQQEPNSESVTGVLHMPGYNDGSVQGHTDGSSVFLRIYGQGGDDITYEGSATGYSMALTMKFSGEKIYSVDFTLTGRSTGSGSGGGGGGTPEEEPPGAGRIWID